MSAVRNRQAIEQWITPPEPALNRYLLRSYRHAANDNRSSSSKSLVTAQIAVCLTLISVLAIFINFYQ
jgi:hypothetical protein